MLGTSEVPSKAKKCGTNGAFRIFKPVVVCTHAKCALGSWVRVGKERFHLEKTLRAPTLHRMRRGVAHHTRTPFDIGTSKIHPRGPTMCHIEIKNVPTWVRGPTSGAFHRTTRFQSQNPGFPGRISPTVGRIGCARAPLDPREDCSWWHMTTM